MSKRNRSLLQKAEVNVAAIAPNKGYLLPSQARRFIRTAIKQSRLLSMVTMSPLRSHTQRAENIRFQSQVLFAGEEGQPLSASERSTPEFGQVEHNAKLFRGEVNLTEELFEDNIEGDAIQQTIITLMGEAVQRDWENLVLNSNTATNNRTFSRFDGVRRLIQSHQVDGSSAIISKTHLKQMLQACPNEFLDKERMVFLTGTDAEIEYRDTIGERATPNGDTALGAVGGRRDLEVGYSGVPIRGIPLWPENLGGGANQTEIVLIDPKNIEVGIWRRIKIRLVEDPRAGKISIILSIRMDAVLQEERASVKAHTIRAAA